MRRASFSLSSISIKHRLPLLIGILLLGIITASTWASYSAIKESALEAGSDRLQNLTQQLANLSEQASNVLLSKTSAAAGKPEIRSFVKDPSPSRRIAAATMLQRFSTAQEPTSLQVELWDANQKLLLIEPEGESAQPFDLATEFAQSSQPPFKATGALRIKDDVIVSPSTVAVNDDQGSVIGYLVRWRRVSTSPEPKQLRDLIGSEAALYFGNTTGDVWTDLVKPVARPPVDISTMLTVTHYMRDGHSVMAAGRPVIGTPFFIVIEFPNRVVMSHAGNFLRRVLFIDAVLLAVGLLAAFALSRSITHPLDLLTGAAADISSGSYSGLVHIRRKDELGALGKAFNAMVVRWSESQRDVELKIQELERAQETASELAAIVESSRDAIIGQSLDGIVTSWNKGSEALYGYSEKEMVGQSIKILLPPGHDGEMDLILAGVQRGESTENFETRRLTKDGKTLSVSLSLSPIRNEAGEIVGISTIARDITERRLAERALQVSEVRYRRLFQSAKDGILILEASSGRIVDVNPYLTEMLGFSNTLLVGKKLWEIGAFSDVAASQQAFEQLQQRGYVRYDDLPLKTSSGDLRNVEFVSSSYVAGEKQVIQCNIRDITERKHAEEQLRETNQRLATALAGVQAKTDELASMTQQLWQASKLATLGELAASIAHELNNPLATISLRMEALARQHAGDPKQSRTLEIVSGEVERMGSLVGTLLEFSRRGHQQISTIDVSGEIEKSVELIEYYLRSRKVEVIEEFEPNAPTIQADRQQLRQVFLNLLTNASDAMPEGGKLIARVRKAQFMDGVNGVSVEFADAGAGIPARDLEKIWEPFFTTKLQGKGTGLGLAICRRVIEEHQGAISIESQPGIGTTVTILLPATDGVAAGFVHEQAGSEPACEVVTR